MFQYSSSLTEQQRTIEDAIVAAEIKEKDFLRTRFIVKASIITWNSRSGPEKGMGSMEQIHLQLLLQNSKSMN